MLAPATYRAITDAGLQLDEPAFATCWQTFPEMSVAEFRRWLEVRVEALNNALRGVPPERVRLHVCWGSSHHPHTEDLPLEHILDLVLFTEFVEAPGLVAERLLKYGNVVGHANVIGGTDCGLGTRVGHPSIAWAKFAAMAEGAREASREAPAVRMLA